MLAAKDELFTRPSGGYTIARSVRLRSSASAYFNRTPASAGNQQKFTWSGWVKLGLISDTTFVSLGTTLGVNLRFSSNQLQSNILTVGSTTSTAVYRDPSAWYHFVLAVDTTQASNNNRLRLYVNGSEVTYSANATITQNANLGANTTTLHALGAEARGGSASTFFDGYMTEVNYVDGQQLTPSSFGTTNAITGVWQPIKYTGTYGTNGFYLNFSDNSSNTATTIGKDYSGNGNNWTPNNISVTAGVTYDSMTDVPTLTSATAANYCVMNPLDKPANPPTITDGNLLMTSGASGGLDYLAVSSIGMTSGKWYCECQVTAGSRFLPGVVNAPASSTTWSNVATQYVSGTGSVYKNNSLVGTYATWTTGDVIGVAYDADNQTLSYYKNNTLIVTLTSLGYSGVSYFYADSFSSSAGAFNFGQRPFTYTPPTGYVALNTYNLPASTITNGAKYMAASTYTGNLTGQSITNGGNNTLGTTFQPDLVWIKSRSAATDNKLTDSVRGATKALISNTTGAETTDTTGVTAINSNGFTVGISTDYNNTAVTYVSWQWQAGASAGSSNTSGTITSTVSAGATQGFSVATYTGNGSAGATFGHGLGVTPAMIIIKARTSTSAENWFVYHQNLTAVTYYLRLNSTNAQTDGGSSGATSRVTAISSSVITLGPNSEVNENTKTYVAYCFSAVAGYSAFGSYTGNGSTDGPFVYLGFRPRFVLVKISSGTVRGWSMWDTSRDIANGDSLNARLEANTSAVEDTGSGGGPIDILSNGFKIRNTAIFDNESGSTFIYAAFAENPFKNSLAR